MQYCRFGRIRCRRPAAAGSAGNADRPRGKTSGLHCRNGAVAHHLGGLFTTQGHNVRLMSLKYVRRRFPSWERALASTARSDATAITRTADRPGDADLVVGALALLEGLCRITRRRLSNRRPPVARSPPRQLLCAPRATGDVDRPSGPTAQGQASRSRTARRERINAQAAARPACRAI